jgi:hypothetical protein
MAVGFYLFDLLFIDGKRGPPIMPHIVARRIISAQLSHKVPRFSTAKLSTFTRFTKWN